MEKQDGNNKMIQHNEEVLHLEEGTLELVTRKPLMSIEDKIQIWNLIWKIISELWFMVICSYITYYLVYIFSYCFVENIKQITHSSITSHDSWPLSGFGNSLP